MATGYTAISLTDGTNTTNLNDTTNYVLQGGGWSPRVARRTSSTIGNRCPYEDVTEEITISVIASTPSGAILKLTYITDLIERAKQYNNQENIDPVTIEVEPQSVASGAWSALVLDGEVILPNNWADLAPTNNIENVTLRIVRRGIWTRSEYTSTTSSATANQRLSAAVTLTDPGKQGYLSEVRVIPSHVENVGSATYATHPGYIIVTNATNKVQVIWGPGGTNDAGNLPAGFSTTHISNSGTGWSLDLSAISSPQITSSAKRVAVIGTFKTTDTTKPITMSNYVDIDLGIGAKAIDSVKFFIPPSTEEDVVFCGVLNWNSNITFLQFLFSGATVSLDALALVDVSDPYTRMFKLNNFEEGTLAPKFIVANSATQTTPVAKLVETSGSDYLTEIPSQGDLWVPFSGTSAYLMRFAMGGGGFWQPYRAGPTAITNTFRVKALESTLIPR